MAAAFRASGRKAAGKLR